jgi:hypothetical protein
MSIGASLERLLVVVEFSREETQMSKFLLLLHEHPQDDADMSPAEMQALIARYRAWAQKLAKEGKLAGGEKLVDDAGRHLTLAGDKPLLTDGPYAEAKEIVGGFFMIEAADYAEAARLAQDCPHLRGRNRIELRQVEVLG